MIDLSSSPVRHHVWQELLDVARLSRYYEALAERHRIKQSIVSFVLLLSAMTGISSLFEVLPPIAYVISSAAIAIVVVWGFIGNHSRKQALLSLVSQECARLEFEWESLWAEINTYQIDEEEAQRRNRELAERLSEVTAWPGLISVRHSRALNRKCLEAANSHIRDKYPAASYQKETMNA